MTIRDELKASGINVTDADKIIITPDYAFIKKKGGKRRAKTKADILIENMISGAEVDTQDITDAKFLVCENLDCAETEINKISAIIHDGKYGVGYYYNRIATNLIQCYLWRD